MNTKTRYEVQTAFIGGTWENVWTDEGKPVTFATARAARHAIDEHIRHRKAARMDASYKDFRVAPVGAVMDSIKDRADALAAKTANAYSVGRYGSWKAVAAMLLRRGYTDTQAEAILRSKWTRWAADMSNRHYGHATSRDLAAYMDKMGKGVHKQVLELELETFGVTSSGATVKPKDAADAAAPTMGEVLDAFEELYNLFVSIDDGEHPRFFRGAKKVLRRAGRLQAKKGAA